MGEFSEKRVAVVTVTYNSLEFFREYLDALASQTRPVDKCILIDSGSTDPAFLGLVSGYTIPIDVFHEKNVGVCAGNNMGWRLVRDYDYVLFLNPDAFPYPDFVEKAMAYMDRHPNVGMITPTLLQYDIEKRKPTGLIDTTGVVRSWYGGIPERDQGKDRSILSRYKKPNEISWVCTAVAMARREALEKVVEPGEQIFDESFFMYKDDTDLSWRIRRAGYKNIHHPELMGYHCRGWKSRKLVSREARLLSARNEVKMCWKNHSPFIVLSLLKYGLVRYLNI